jgi:hypothetical protein
MNSDDGRGRRPEAGALDPNTECYADSVSEVASRCAAASLGGSG